MNIEEVQCRLWEQSRAHKQNRESGTPLFPTNPYDGRIGNLMDLMHNPTWIAAACDRVLKRSRGKAAGVDGVRVSDFEKSRENRLEQLRLDLKRGTYRPLPPRRVEIPKANGKMRQLGIPCLRDKIVQEAIRMALEPIFEVEFHDSSYGFRPNRSTHHAVVQCRQAALNGFTWIIEGDVKACFDEISHKAILRRIREKVIDSKFLALIQLLLKAGVEIDPRTGGPVVNESLETSVEGIFACGNVLHVHDLVDYVTEESRKAGASAALYIQNKAESGGKECTAVAGKGIKYVLPQRIGLSSGQEKLDLYYRTSSLLDEARVVVTADGEIIKETKKRRFLPSEMERIKIDLDELRRRNCTAVKIEVGP